MARPGPKKLTDPKEVRALAHPLRLRLLTELQARDAATATVLADALGEPVNRVSFHLRLLAKYGFIEEAPELARDGRDRWWRRTHADGLDWDDLALTPEGREAMEAHQGGNLALRQIRAFFSARKAPWEPGPFNHDWYMRLTPEEAAEFDREYLELCFRWREQIEKKLASGDTEGRDTFAIFIYGFPLPDKTSEQT